MYKRQAKKEAFAAEQEELKKLIEVKTVTKSGKRVEVCGNIGKPEDIDQVGAWSLSMYKNSVLNNPTPSPPLAKT